MKFLLASLLIAAASAFSPNSLPNSRVSNTRVNIVDPDILHHLAQYGEEAATAMFINCDNSGCELVEGVHEADGWYFDSKAPAPDSHHSQMLMMSMEDTE
mmetsp:Transcript_26703/g.64969  ORF Transcript_26703/g.64969 Transcript_26703/m.64969 type:complete len:100 (+) Transcript_26703:100-399(+)|eukprot:CAMPEP_0113619224 /NCGR_PEP_ID=MMETSP0017_2-20120614/9756_1 /TAXON_ID=2856 /ORGANISM="Cylindrotheca closterium" /LENGTH=99 /DNA_ID=CAMNT_0000528785 /DNA_START=61 /DNA_END=360 /DNA_ORIENTATION=+ /assembly_acc=CAM_ASM_000147